MAHMIKTVFFILFSSLLMHGSAADLDYYFGKDIRFNPDIPTPESVLGYQVGEWHVRPDQLVYYMKAVAAASDRVQIEEIGRTHEARPLIHLTISSPANLAKIDEHQANHFKLATGQGGDPKTQPIVIWKGYSVHGNESSGTNASLLAIYYLAAAEGIDDLLNNSIIIMDPAMNPDGMGRFAHWVNMHKGKQLVDNPASRELSEAWPRGRTNHYWFDLNRDWLLLQHPESRARIARYQAWLPNILTDHHEMGTATTFFFQPGIPSRRNPYTPKMNEDLTRKIATYHAKAFNKDGILYYSEQSFDDFYYGKGSTYPDVQGTIGILFEQASSRGHLQKNHFGPLTFPMTIKNQLTTTLSTFAAGLDNREEILTYQSRFYPNALEEARKDKVKAYVFGTSTDVARMHEMVTILDQHKIDLYKLARPVDTPNGRIENGYVVPLEQRQYLLIKSIFEPMTTFNDNTFYDVSTWHFPSLFWMDWTSLEGRAFSKDLMGDKVEDPTMPVWNATIDSDAYAYIVPWDSYYAPRLAYKLLEAGVRMRYALESFTSDVGGERRVFDSGSLIIPMGVQSTDAATIREHLKQGVQRDGVQVFSTGTGLTPVGGDLGGPSFGNLQKPSVMLLVGNGVNSYAAGELWHLLDARFQMHVTLVDVDRLGRVDMNDFTHLVMANGRYNLSAEAVGRIKSWVNSGGTLFAERGAVSWVSRQEILKVEMARRTPNKEPRPYAEARQDGALQRVSGSLFSATLDLTHPLNYGLVNPNVALFRTTTLMMKPHASPYATPVRYTSEPLISGYISQQNLELLADKAAVIADGVGRGAVVLMTEPPSFRAITYGPSRIFMNALFFSDSINRTSAVE